MLELDISIADKIKFDLILISCFFRLSIEDSQAVQFYFAGTGSPSGTEIPSAFATPRP